MSRGIVFLTPGTGGWYCGACIRDNALAKALHATGHRVSVLPMYLPLHLDEEPLMSGRGAPVFFGGIGLYLRMRFPIIRRAPRWFGRWLDHPALLRGVARHSHMTSPRGHGEMTLAMLRQDSGLFEREMEALCEWLEVEKPAVLCLSTALQAGMIRRLKQRFDTKIVCFFQGEDGFLDGLPQPYRDACWRELSDRVRDAHLLIAPSTYHAELMRGRLGLEGSAIHVLPNGITLDGYLPVKERPGPPVIGYLARMCREKGLELMVEAFVLLRRKLAHPDARLVLAGTPVPGSGTLVAALKDRLSDAGLTDEVRWLPDLTREEKTAMLGSLSLFSVPAIAPEAFGLYVVEAMAAGVPVVQPDSFAFPEIIGNSGAGVLVPPGDPHALARAWHALLNDPPVLREMAAKARQAAERLHDIQVMRDGFLELLDGFRAAPD